MATKNIMRHFFKVFAIVCVLFLFQKSFSQEDSFHQTIKSKKKPWTNKPFKNNNFQFAIISDRTGGHRSGVFSKAIEKLNLLMPEFVISVGDLIEGYTKQNEKINKQWSEFDNLVNPLEMKFFPLPGNHDISNDVMRKTWIEKYGVAYYHFIYKDVLFLALDTNDGDGDAVLSKKQINYFKKVIKKNKTARWVMVFMHHPVWLYKDFSSFKELEKLLPKNRYTVYAGHFHQYLQTNRNESNYYVLATTGGGSKLRGAKFGEFDHISWITMTENGPKMVNLKLNGMIEHDVVNTEKYEKKKLLITATNFSSVMTYNEEKTAGKIHLGINNKSNDSLFFKGKIFHNHHLELSDNQLKIAIPPNSFKGSSIDWKLSKKSFFRRFNPVELDFSIGYKTNPLDHPFQIHGTYIVPKSIQKNEVQFTEPNIFTNITKVSLQTNTKNVVVKYTLDGSTPTKNSKTYLQPIKLNKTTAIKVAFFDINLENKTGYLEKKYTKVNLLNPIKISKRKNGLNYKYYEGNFTQLPNFETLNVIRSGIAKKFDVENIAQNRIDHYAIKYDGFIDVPKDGLYTFYTHSDDGSKLYIHNKLVVDNGGSHSARTRKGYISLKKGIHPIKITYFEDYSGQELAVYWKLPNTSEKKKINFKYLFQ